VVIRYIIFLYRRKTEAQRNYTAYPRIHS
jgi:hypothetical protein